jgi:patatin-like phospholipase/acyl hydrolase
MLTHVSIDSKKNIISEPFRSGGNYPILVLDGGGSKGVYTLGMLEEIENRLNQLNQPIHQYFKLIYGTSTGAIIASLIGLGYSIKEIKELYFNYIPKIMSQPNKYLKSTELEKLCNEVFGSKTFDSFKTNVGIVAVNYSEKKPLIFKTNTSQLHSIDNGFQPGFGCTISDAVQASCSAYPLFNKKTIRTKYHGKITAIDGGFLAKNATLYALLDAEKALGIPKSNIDVLNLGTGQYPEKPTSGITWLLKQLYGLDFIQSLISSSNNTNEELINILFQGVQITRISNTYKDKQYATNMLEKDLGKLRVLYHLGKQSFLTHPLNSLSNKLAC